MCICWKFCNIFHNKEHNLTKISIVAFHENVLGTAISEEYIITYYCIEEDLTTVLSATLNQVTGVVLHYAEQWRIKKERSC